MSQTAELAPVPAHVPSHLVVDFDVYHLPLANEFDPQTAYLAYRDKGDLFWTPHNGGHWVATRAEDLKAILNDWTHFIRAPRVTIPDIPESGLALPLQVDPPEHAAYRRPLTKALLPQVVEKMADKVRRTTIELMDQFVARGECDFVNEFSHIFPILIFLDLVDLPRSDRLRLLPLAEDLCRGASSEIRMKAFAEMAAYLAPIVAERQANPGEDMFSAMVNVEIDGRQIPFDQALSFCTTVLVAGLDTVAAMLGFVTRHFAMRPDHRREFLERMDDEAFVNRVVEEILRRYAIANSTRCVAEDMEYKGIRLAKGDMILTPNTYIGLDDRVVDRPMEVDFSRDARNLHAAFDVGAHTCPGATLARRELRVFLQEWFRRIPDFAIKPGTRPRMATGMVSSVLELELVWPSPEAKAA